MIRSIARTTLALAAILTVAILTAAVLTVASAQAEEKLRIIHTSSSLYTAAFVAADQGRFAAHGLDVSFSLTAINSNIPAALISGSAEIGGPTTPVLIQAADGGLDIVAIAGSGLAYPGATNEAAVARAGSGIVTARDYIGRRVGVPGVGTIVDVFFRNWLMLKDVDPAKVNFVEIPGPQQIDALRGGTVDAVVANDPQLYRLIRSGVGVEAGRIMDVLPGPVPIIVYAVTADYARTHRDAILAFQAAYGEGIAEVAAHPEAAKASMARHLNLSADVVKDIDIPKYQQDVAPAQLQIMIDILRRQGTMTRTLDPNSLVYH